MPLNMRLPVQGVAEGAVTGAKAARYAEVAANLTRTCWQARLLRLPYPVTAASCQRSSILFEHMLLAKQPHV